MSDNDNKRRKNGKTLIFRAWITHPDTGERIYPKNGKAFPIWVDNDELN